MRRNLLYILLLIIPLLNGCISDNCTDCADMAYDTKVKLNIAWPKQAYSNTTKTNDDIYINDFTLFVFNTDGTLNTLKKVNNPSGTGDIIFTTSVNMNITSSANYIYAIANCSDLLSENPTSSIAKQVKLNFNNLKSYFDNYLSAGIDSLFDGTLLMLTGYTNAIIQSGTNPYNYEANVYLKPIVSKFDINVSSSAPSDFINCIQSIEAFVLNSRSQAKFFSPNINYTFIHGKYESFWSSYPYNNFSFEDINNQNSNLSKLITYTPGTSSFTTSAVSIYSPENDVTLGNNRNTLVVLKIKYRMADFEGGYQEFYRFLTVPLNPPDGSNLSNKRGTNYAITFNLSGNYLGADTPLSSMMQPYSPLPFKTTKNLIYVPPEDYSRIKIYE